jgi:hypothetical protein
MRDTGLLVMARDEDVADLAVPLEVDETVAVHPQDGFDLLGIHAGEGVVVIRGLENELAGATRRDHVEHAHALPHKLVLDPEVRVGLRDDANRPPRLVGQRAVFPVGGDLAAAERLSAGTVSTTGVGGGRPLGPDE